MAEFNACDYCLAAHISHLSPQPAKLDEGKSPLPATHRSADPSHEAALRFAGRVAARGWP